MNFPDLVMKTAAKLERRRERRIRSLPLAEQLAVRMEDERKNEAMRAEIDAFLAESDAWWEEYEARGPR